MGVGGGGTVEGKGLGVDGSRTPTDTAKVPTSKRSLSRKS